MKAIISHDYGTYQNLKLVADMHEPVLLQNKILVKTVAVALAPGDVRVLSGACRIIQGPPSFPYIPGGDLCGTITSLGGKIDSTKTGYNVGDRVAARFTEGPRGALGEYAIIAPTMTGKVPDNVSSEDAAALASSGTIALSLSKNISEGERVLIIGAGGGVGAHLCQFLKMKGVEYVAGVSRDPTRLKREPISCHDALDYTQKDIYDFQEWKNIDVHEKFDTVVDLATDAGGWLRLLEQSKKKDGSGEMVVKTAKEGGRYLATSPDEPWFKIDKISGALQLFIGIPLYRYIYSRLTSRGKLPTYTYAFALDNDAKIMDETLKLASEGKLKACVDSRGPFEFTTEGAQEAFKVQESRHGQGKVIISSFK